MPSFRIICVTLFTAALALAAEEKRIAVVNIANVFNNYAKIKDIQDNLKRDFETPQKGLEDEERLIVMAKTKLENDPADQNDPKLFRAKLDLEQRKFDFQTKMKELLGKIEERRMKEMKSVLEEIKLAISQVGRIKKYDLVLRAPEFDDFDANPAKPADKENRAKNSRELVERFRENPVLYFGEGVDITGEVTDILNANYKARGGK